jgi:hypothetical protein
MLAERCGGAFAFVVDEGNGLWCVGSKQPEHRADKLADDFYRTVVVSRMKELRSGGKIDQVKMDASSRYVAVSFASIYVLCVWFDADFDPFTARALTRKAVPIIESLIVSMPPPSGPYAGEGAGRSRA